MLKNVSETSTLKKCESRRCKTPAAVNAAATSPATRPLTRSAIRYTKRIVAVPSAAEIDRPRIMNVMPSCFRATFSGCAMPLVRFQQANQEVHRQRGIHEELRGVRRLEKVGANCERSRKDEVFVDVKMIVRSAPTPDRKT